MQKKQKKIHAKTQRREDIAEKIFAHSLRLCVFACAFAFWVFLIANVQTAAAQEIKWLAIGSLHSWFRADGCEPEVGRTGLQSDQQDGMRWPAQFLKQDNVAAKGLWIGTTNYTDADQYGANTYQYKVVHVGPRGWDLEREFMPITFKMIGRYNHPQVLVDGLPGSEMEFTDIVDEVDPNLPCDRMIYNVVNTSLGITMTRRIMAYSQQHHDNYFIYEYVFKNTGNVDKDPEIEKPQQTLTEVYFFFQYRYAVSREGADLSGLNSPRWGINEMLSTRGEASRADGPQYPGSYEDWVKGNRNADSLRCQFAWMGRHSQAPVDLIGVPDFKFNTGRFTAPQFIGVVTLHADKSAADKSDDPRQPTTTTYQQSDDPPARPNDQFDATRMAEEWKWIGRGKRLPRHDEAVGNTFPNLFEGTPGGFSNMNGYGPYTLAPGDSIRIVMAEGVNGLNRQLCESLGAEWAKQVPPYRLPNGTTTTDRDVFKNTWVFTGRDSLFQTFGRARQTFNSGYKIPSAPPPPDYFEVISAGDRIGLTWSNSAESATGFAGYRIYRAVGKYDTTYQEVFACGKGTNNPQIVNSFDDTQAIRKFKYFYFIASFDDGSANQSSANPGPLHSSLFWTRTIEGAELRRAANDTVLSEIVIVPNPFNVRARKFQYPEEPDKITFLNIPGQCTIKIFTERGDLIKTIDHTNGSGDEEWNSTTEFGQVVVSGIYIAVIETPDNQRAVRKFVIIR